MANGYDIVGVTNVMPLTKRQCLKCHRLSGIFFWIGLYDGGRVVHKSICAGMSQQSSFGIEEIVLRICQLVNKQPLCIKIIWLHL